jgi:creatinine amidohydrolase
MNVSASDGSGHRLEDLTSPEAARLSASVLVVPLGSTEQHGPHLPLSTDTDLARALCEQLASSRGDVVVAPAIAYGASGEHKEFAGTVSIGHEALRVLLVELCRSALCSFANVLIVSTHGGNAETVRSVERQLEAEGRDIWAWTPKMSGDAHAGRSETSVQLALAPNRVHVDAFEAGNVRPLGELLETIRNSSVRAVSENGVLGDPHGASREEGAEILAALAADLSASLDSWIAARTGPRAERAS